MMEVGLTVNRPLRNAIHAAGRCTLRVVVVFEADIFPYIDVS